ELPQRHEHAAGDVVGALVQRPPAACQVEVGDAVGGAAVAGVEVQGRGELLLGLVEEVDRLAVVGGGLGLLQPGAPLVDAPPARPAGGGPGPRARRAGCPGGRRARRRPPPTPAAPGGGAGTWPAGRAPAAAWRGWPGARGSGPGRRPAPGRSGSAAATAFPTP